MLEIEVTALKNFFRLRKFFAAHLRTSYLKYALDSTILLNNCEEMFSTLYIIVFFQNLTFLLYFHTLNHQNMLFYKVSFIRVSR